MRLQNGSAVHSINIRPHADKDVLNMEVNCARGYDEDQVNEFSKSFVYSGQKNPQYEGRIITLGGT